MAPNRHESYGAGCKVVQPHQEEEDNTAKSKTFDFSSLVYPDRGIYTDRCTHNSTHHFMNEADTCSLTAIETKMIKMQCKLG